MGNIVAKFFVILAGIVLLPVIALAIVAGYILRMLETVIPTTKDVFESLKGFGEKYAEVWHSLDD